MEKKILTFQEYLQAEIKDCEEKEIENNRLVNETGKKEYFDMLVFLLKKKNNIQTILNQFNMNFQQ